MSERTLSEAMEQKNIYSIYIEYNENIYGIYHCRAGGWTLLLLSSGSA